MSVPERKMLPCLLLQNWRKGTWSPLWERDVKSRKASTERCYEKQTEELFERNIWRRDVKESHIKGRVNKMTTEICRDSDAKRSTWQNVQEEVSWKRDSRAHECTQGISFPNVRVFLHSVEHRCLVFKEGCSVQLASRCRATIEICRSRKTGKMQKQLWRPSSFEGHLFSPAVFLNSKGHTVLNPYHLARFICLQLQENLEEEMRKMEACLMSSTTYHCFHALWIFAYASCKCSNHFVSISRNNFKKTSKQNFNLRQGSTLWNLMPFASECFHCHRCPVT